MTACHVLYSTGNGANLTLFFQKLIFCFERVEISKTMILVLNIITCTRYLVFLNLCNTKVYKVKSQSHSF